MESQFASRFYHKPWKFARSIRRAEFEGERVLGVSEHGREAEALGSRTFSLGAPGIARKTEGSFFFFLPTRQRARVHRNDERRRIGSDYDLASPQRKERDNGDDCSSAYMHGSPFMTFQLEYAAK